MVLGAVSRGLGAAYRQVVTRGAVLMIAGWIAAAILVPLELGVQQPTGGLGTLLPSSGKAVSVAEQSLRLFRVPVLSQTTVVVYKPGGLSALTRADVATYALSYLNKPNRLMIEDASVIAAVPIPTKAPDVAVTYLYYSGNPSPPVATALADLYAEHFAGQPGLHTYITGLVPAQVSQSDLLTSRLDLFAALSVALVGVIVALTFRSLLAPIVVLAVAGVAYIVAEPLLNLLARLLGFPMPEQVQPLVVALLLGVVTDYCVLQFSEMRVHLSAGINHGDAVRHALRRNAHVIAVAALTVIGGTIALLAANLQLFRAFGPALSLTVVVGVVVSLTLTPAIMTLLGNRLFRLRGGLPRQSPAQAGTSKTAAFLVRRLTKPGWAIIALLLAGGALVGAAWPLSTMRLDVSFTDALPDNDPVQQGAAVLKQSGVQGVTGPTEVILFQRGINRQVSKLQKLQSEVAAQPGVAQVLGPKQDPLPEKLGVVYSINGDAARLVIILKHDPLTADAIDRVRQLQARLPALAQRAGLSSARIGVTGETAIASELAALTRSNLRITLAVAAAVDFIILALFLRALFTPIVLLMCSALGVAATLGITTWVFQDVRGDSGLTFYIAFAAAVLLLALGSDYNVFTVGTIWEEARRQPLRAALVSAVPRSSRAITAAGLTLAATLAMVAIIPLEPSRQIAFAMGLGLLIDTLIVRPVLTPAALTLLGRAAGWPGSRIHVRRRSRTAPAPPPYPAPVGTAMAPPPDVPARPARP